MKTSSAVFVGIGSNLGNRLKNLYSAIDLLKKNPQINIVKISSFYETEPCSSIPQGYFLNGVIKMLTTLDPHTLLDILQTTENKLEPQRHARDYPRIIDLDLLIYDDLNISTPRLTLPHPRMFERTFVMTPLLEIEPDIGLRIPNFKLQIRE